MITRAHPLALATIGIGLVGLIFTDFALQWQPVPPNVPGRELLAIVTALLLIAAGALTLVPGRTTLGARAMTGLYGVWVIILLLPRVALEPLSVVAWLGVAEIAALAAGALALSAPDRPTASGIARAVFGISALIFGLSHFVYADFTAGMVPKFMPAPLFWAYATGLGHAAAGLAILTNRYRRAAATALAAMCGSFVLLLHLPRVIAAPDSHAEWTMLLVAACISGAAWAMRDATPGADGSR
jgi:uncharacterized membrane protein